MKNKEKKFKSLKSVLILLQQLQTKYYGKCVFFLDNYISGDVDVFIKIGSYSKIVFFRSADDCNVWKTTYQDLLEYLKTHTNEEQE